MTAPDTVAKPNITLDRRAPSRHDSSQLGAHHGVTKTYVSRVIRLNFLAPQIVESIIAGTQPVALDAKRLLALHDLPLAWSEQGSALHLI